MSLSAGDLLDDKYRIVRLLGEGGMGAVYEGENVRIHRRVAIKVLHAEVAGNADAVARFEREAQAAGRIGSEHIVEVLDLGSLPSGARYLVMEFMDGDSLSHRIKERGRLTPQELYPIARQLLDALAAAHGAGIVHRDLKPDNVYLLTNRHGSKDFVKLLDFGISKFADLTSGTGLSMTRTGVVMGTPYYMAPEQAKGSRELDLRVDLYAVGVVLYEALTGKVPFDAETFNELLFKIVLETARPIEELAPGVDPGLCAVVRRAMAREPDDRFQTAAEFRAALDQWAATAGAAVADASGRHSQIALSQLALSQRGSAPNLGLTPGNWTEAPDGINALRPNRTRLYLATLAIVVTVFGAGGFLLIGGRRDNERALASAASASAAAAAAATAAPTAQPAEPAAPAAPEPETPSVELAPAASSAPTALTRPLAARPRPNAPHHAAAPAPAAIKPRTPEPAATTKSTKNGRPIRTEL